VGKGIETIIYVGLTFGTLKECIINVKEITIGGIKYAGCQF